MQVLESALERVLYSRVGEAYTVQLGDDHGARVSLWDHHFSQSNVYFSYP